MTIPAISSISSALPTSLSSLSPATPSTAPTGSSGSSFASILSQGLDQVTSAQNKADSLAIGAATGNLTDIHDYTIAATQASLLTELATTIRSKGVDAFNQIMGMQA